MCETFAQLMWQSVQRWPKLNGFASEVLKREGEYFSNLARLPRACYKIRKSGWASQHEKDSRRNTWSVNWTS